MNSHGTRYGIEDIVHDYVSKVCVLGLFVQNSLADIAAQTYAALSLSAKLLNVAKMARRMSRRHTDGGKGKGRVHVC